MSTQIPLRTARIPALQRQCLFLRHQYQNRAHNLSQCQSLIPATRAFSNTPSRPSKRHSIGQDKAQTRAAAEAQVGPSPKVNYEKAQTDADAMAEDIGLLQNTIIRAPFSELKGIGVRGITSYYWDLVKSKGTALYSRYYYRACIQKTGWTRFFPIDLFNNKEYIRLAQKNYEKIYSNLAKGTTAPLKQTCLPPLLKSLESRILSRGPVQLQWRLHGPFKSSRVVSHRAAPLGESMPDTAYRQVVVRLVSEQSLRALPASSSSTTTPNRAIHRLPWIPDAARQQLEKQRQRERKMQDENGGSEVAALDAVEEENVVPKTVTEYLVLQKRVIRGKEDDWKVWGFAEESTPSVIERDQEYWRKMLDMQAGGA
ncbi:hypothetical protein COCMIDRAFT_34806 [Bipolaris oryzae ATCC 44560]|uniref:Tim44-like domain-containing protein n=1 Tax=Bipolaris oryzae ATCC 44560 TaxID=930090 RepID=W6ZJX6_COCMI|nr:uncharacterized protein COCMIDRAFT_34806 [Bipolaris oryzae ATCC 44560]EUC47739.1 hypothetical protein COCMIDRAFT_34806 [Bipolaris oryzae ATCC 44560]